MIEKVFKKAFVFGGIYDDGISGDIFYDLLLGLAKFDAGKKSFEHHFGEKTNFGRHKTAVMVIGFLQGPIDQPTQAPCFLLDV